MFIHAGCKSVIASECWKGRHHSVFPSKADTGVACKRNKKGATPFLSVRIDFVCLGNSGDDSSFVFYRKQHGAVCIVTAQGAKINRISIDPQSRPLNSVSKL